MGFVPIASVAGTCLMARHIYTISCIQTHDDDDDNDNDNNIMVMLIINTHSHEPK